MEQGGGCSASPSTGCGGGKTLSPRDLSWRQGESEGNTFFGGFGALVVVLCSSAWLLLGAELARKRRWEAGRAVGPSLAGLSPAEGFVPGTGTKRHAQE